MFWTILFYAVIAVGVLLGGGVLYYRIDWARHPEKYKDLVEADEKEKKKNTTGAAKQNKDRKKK